MDAQAGEMRGREQPAAQACWLSTCLLTQSALEGLFHRALRALQHRCEEVHAACFGDQLFALTYLADSSASAALILPHPLHLVLLDPFSSHLAHRPCFNLPLSAYAKIAFLPPLCSCC